MADDDPQTLRQRADRYQRIALRMTDAEAVRALTTLAEDYNHRANAVDARLEATRRSHAFTGLSEMSPVDPRPFAD